MNIPGTSPCLADTFGSRAPNSRESASLSDVEKQPPNYGGRSVHPADSGVSGYVSYVGRAITDLNSLESAPSMSWHHATRGTLGTDLSPADFDAIAELHAGFDNNNSVPGGSEISRNNDLSEGEILEAVLQMEVDFHTPASFIAETSVFSEFDDDIVNIDDIVDIFDGVWTPPDNMQKDSELSPLTSPSFLAGAHNKSTIAKPGKGKQFATNEQARSVRKATDAECVRSLRSSKWQANYNHTPGAKAARVNYAKTPHGRAAKRRYEQSLGGKTSHRAAQSRYIQSPKAREVRRKAQAIRYARVSAYRKELARSNDEVLAKQKGEAAAEKKRWDLQKIKEQDLQRF